MDYPGDGDFRGRREASIWQQLNRVLRVMLLLAGILVVVSLFVPQQRRLAQSRSDIENLQAQVNDQKQLLARQTREVRLLTTDPTYLETIARDRLDVMKEGETVFRFEQPKRK
ncbi:MAG: septum formation initiator family protein [Verrucomicrobiota bacterium]|nr:septum formation initiator family protein [Verrucomicrobiota bacterium]